MADVEYTGTGLVDNKTEGQTGRLVITGRQDEEGVVAPAHLIGVATKMDGSRVKFKSEYYSLCISQIHIVSV